MHLGLLLSTNNPVKQNALENATAFIIASCCPHKWGGLLLLILVCAVLSCAMWLIDNL